MRWVQVLAGLFAVFLLVGATIVGVAFFYGVPAASQDDYGPRIEELEERVTLLEATVAALQGTDQASAELHTLTGAYVSLPSARSGTDCVVDAEEAEVVILHDANGEFVGVGNLEQGELRDDGRCVAPFTLEDVPESPIYTVYIGREVIGAAYSLTLADIKESGWDIEIISRYNP